jgi:hypothetical protein
MKEECPVGVMEAQEFPKFFEEVQILYGVLAQHQGGCHGWFQQRGSLFHSNLERAYPDGFLEVSSQEVSQPVLQSFFEEDS